MSWFFLGARRDRFLAGLSISSSHFDLDQGEAVAPPIAARPVGVNLRLPRPTVQSLLIGLRWMRVWLVRALERCLPLVLFRAVVAPIVLIRALRGLRAHRAALRELGRRQKVFAKPVSTIALLRARYQNQLTDLVRHWPDRLCEPRWQKRCALFGEDVLRGSLATGRPVVLVTLHCGPTLQMFHWLRASGLEIAAMTSSHYDPSDRIRIHYVQQGDRANGLAGVPWVFGTSLDDLFNIKEFLAAPNRALLMAMDAVGGKTAVTIGSESLRLNVQLGGFTLAAITNAIVIPCLARTRSRLRCEIHFRPPVPDDLIIHRNRPAAAEHVLRELLPLVAELPQQADACTLLHVA